MVMDVSFDEVFENVMMNAIIAACDGNGVLDGLAVSENGAGASMHVDVAAGNAWISGTKYTEAAITEDLVITAAHATLDRKDLVTYDPTTSAPIVTTGTAAATPEPPDIPAGDILLAIVDVGAAVTQIMNADIADGIVIIQESGVAKSLFDATTFLYATANDTPQPKTPSEVRSILNVADGADVTGSNPPQAHGASVHTDITRELFVPVTYANDGLAPTHTYWVGGKLTDAATKWAYGIFKVPTDYVSDGVLQSIVMTNTNGNMANETSARYAANNQSEQTHYDTSGQAFETITQHYVEILANSLTFNNLAVGDVVGCVLQRSGGHSSDTVNDDVYAIGFIFTYTANQ